MKILPLRSSGLTLIELLIAMAMTAVVAAAVYQLLLAQIANYRSHEALEDHYQLQRIGLGTVAREIREMGYGLLSQTDFSPCPKPPDRIFEIHDGRSLKFWSDLYGVQTVLEKEAFPGDTELFIPDDTAVRQKKMPFSGGRAFNKNDTLYLYYFDAYDEMNRPLVQKVECHRLTSRGTSGRIRLTHNDPVRNYLPAGSLIHVVNEVHYFYNPETRRLMRSLDGGTEVLVEGLDGVVFEKLGGRILARFFMARTLRPQAQGVTMTTSVHLRNQ